MEDNNIRHKVEQWADKTRTALLRNLRSRREVALGRFVLVSAISVNIRKADERDVAVDFVFERKQARFIRERGVVQDPLFNRFQPVQFERSRLSYLKKKSIYAQLEQKYFQQLIIDISGEYVELAQNLVINVVNGTSNDS